MEIEDPAGPGCRDSPGAAQAAEGQQKRENKEKGKIKFMKKMNNKRGFTLAELLIVVAIIAVLVAISIPIFTNQLEKARESTDVANIRDIYAEVSVGLLDGSLEKANNTMNVSGGYTATLNGDVEGSGTPTKTFTVTVAGVKFNQTGFSDWKIGNPDIAGVTVNTVPAAGTEPIVFTFTVGDNQTYLSGIAFTTT